MYEPVRRRRLPPLNALRAFEAAARHLSFTRAADELAVTQAAVSHQVKALEGWLGLKLFDRQNRTIYLTRNGQAYLPAVREAFDILAEATRRLAGQEARGVLSVSAVPSFAAKWLVPRLADFRRRHPEIDVRISANDRLIDFARDDVDLAIRMGNGEWPGLAAVFFMDEDLFPVCAPALLEGPHPLRRPEDLAHHTLLHDDMRQDWRTWLTAAGVEGIDPEPGPGFTDSSMVIQAAVEGQGVALGRSALASSDLAAGRLVKPFEVRLPASFAYYIVYPAAAAEQPKVKAFTDWLLETAAAEVEAAPSHAGRAGRTR
ncbi:MAG: transcriptional regulator GcvA [Alphaproteobacteria bacterium]|jgi:LysR family glycine cleavage system transcriptional activator|nr:transcriptional regulator GcvA [Alphaproteobacteria bacterium]